MTNDMRGRKYKDAACIRRLRARNRPSVAANRWRVKKQTQIKRSICYHQYSRSVLSGDKYTFPSQLIFNCLLLPAKSGLCYTQQQTVNVVSKEGMLCSG